jgi:uncharacterized protein YbjT (DUF2867 family)
MVRNESLFLITGATGTQGGATAREMLTTGHRVRILTRNPAGTAAAALAKQGAEVAKGDMGEPATLEAAMRDVYGVFSLQKPDMDGSDSERRHGLSLLKAAQRAGVHQYVHTSVCQAGEHAGFPRWDAGYWPVKYWTDKWEIEQAVRGAGFEHCTVLRPTFIMDNFKHSKAQFLYPQLRRGVIISPVLPDSVLQLIAGDDIGAFARAAFEDPSRFHGKTIELVGDALTMPQIAATLGKALGKSVESKSVGPNEALKAGIADKWVRSQEWINDVGYHSETAWLPSYGVPLTSFSGWVGRHAEDIVIEG